MQNEQHHFAGAEFAYQSEPSTLRTPTRRRTGRALPQQREPVVAVSQAMIAAAAYTHGIPIDAELKRRGKRRVFEVHVRSGPRMICVRVDAVSGIVIATRIDAVAPRRRRPDN